MGWFYIHTSHYSNNILIINSVRTDTGSKKMKEKKNPTLEMQRRIFPKSLSLYFSDSSQQILWEVPGSFSGAAFLTLLLANAGDLRISFQSYTSGSCLYILGSLDTADLYSI